MLVVAFDDLIILQFMDISFRVLVDLWVLLIPVELGIIDLFVIILHFSIAAKIKSPCK